MEPKSLKEDENEKKVSSCHGLSTAQIRMVMMQQAAPESTAYVETFAVCTTNQTEPRDFFKALTTQHPILTSKIDVDETTNEFVVTRGSSVVFDVIPEVLVADTDVEDFIKQTTPIIDIFRGPLVRFRYCIQGENIIIVCHLHHVIVDSVTYINLLRSIHVFLEGASNVRGAPFTDKSYSSFVDWETAVRQSEQHNTDKVFWEKSFSDIPTRSSLAILPLSECEWSDANIYKARQTKIIISRESTESISKYCKSIAVKPFAYYLACTMLVYQRYIGTTDVTLAVPVSTRPEAHQTTDGLFVNTVLFRKVLRTDINFTDYVKDVAESWMKTYNHSQFPLEDIVKFIKEAHGVSMPSFCSMMINSYSLGASKVMRIPAKHAKMPFNFDIIFKKKEKTIEMIVEWAEELIDVGVAQRLADSVAHAFCEAHYQADDVTQSIQVLSSSELELLASFSHHQEKPQAILEQPVHLTFEDYAIKNPELIAVSCRDVHLTYKQLNLMASSIAQGLLENTDQITLKDRPVVIVMQKDEYTVASVLGIWKAGGHFLPVGVSSQSSLKGIFERCEPAAVLYNTRPEDLSLPTSAKEQCPVINVKDLIIYPADDMVQSGVVGSTPVDCPAYVIRTSGSTGTPKQCCISHKSLRITAAAYKKMYKLPDMTVNCLQWAPISFDVFPGDLMRALVCSPGRLTICPDEYRLDVFHILNLIQDQNVTLAEFTPQFARQLVENATSDQLRSFQLLIISSDVLQVQIYYKIRQLLNPTQRVINAYGLTEAAIDSSCFEGPLTSKTRSGMVPIGKPFPGVHFHVLNLSTLQQCPVGTVGELYISGDVLASGDAELVHLRHLKRLALKTGDAAYWLPTGDIDLTGRLDSMVKLRGFRISTTEIENKILQLVPGVKAACVVLVADNKDSDSTESLCAYLVLDENRQTCIEIDRRYVCKKLQGELAYYMLPDIVAIIDEVPLTAHGKVNYKMLPSINDAVRLDIKKEITDNTMETETASTLRMLVAEAMGFSDSSQIPSDITFMELGAHSLILLRLSVLLRQKTDFGVKVTDLFRYPSIRSLAGYIDSFSSTDMKET